MRFLVLVSNDRRFYSWVRILFTDRNKEGDGGKQ